MIQRHVGACNRACSAKLRTDKAPVQTAVILGGVLELNVYVDGDKLTGWRQNYFGGVATIKESIVTGNVVKPDH